MFLQCFWWREKPSSILRCTDWYWVTSVSEKLPVFIVMIVLYIHIYISLLDWNLLWSSVFLRTFSAFTTDAQSNEIHAPRLLEEANAYSTSRIPRILRNSKFQLVDGHSFLSWARWIQSYLPFYSFFLYELISFHLLMYPADICLLDILHCSIFLRHAQP